MHDLKELQELAQKALHRAITFGDTTDNVGNLTHTIELLARARFYERLGPVLDLVALAVQEELGVDLEKLSRLAEAAQKTDA